MADITQTLYATQGTDGRVKLHAGSPIIIAGATNWKRNSKTSIIPIPHFESPANADGLVQPYKLRGLGDGGTVDLEGIYNLDPTAQTETGTTGLDNGVYVALDLMISKEESDGYSNVLGWVSNFQVGQQIDANKACMFTCTIEVDGPFPAFGPVA